MKDFEFLKDEVPDVSARADLLSKAFHDFVQKYPRKSQQQFSFIDDAALITSGVYFEILQRSARPYVQKRINKFRMASIMEIAIVRVQPILHDDLVIQRSLNGELAFFCAMSIAISMPPSHFEKKTNIKVIEDLFDTLKKQHIDWLKNKELTTQPIFTNGAFLCLFYLLWRSEHPAMAH